MKKLLIVLVLVMGAFIVNAQKTPVKLADLPKAITDNVAKDYVGFTIKDANKDVANNVTTYNVVVTKGTTQETLCYDANGKFLKKMEAKSGMAKEAPKTTKPPTKNK
jgi:hypothetical protein